MLKNNFDFNKKPEMKEAFEAVVDAGFIKDYMIDIKASYKIDLVGWTAGIVRKKEDDDSVVVYSFTDHKILIGMSQNDGVQISYHHPQSRVLPALLVDRWKKYNFEFCPVNRYGIMFNGKRWFRTLKRINSPDVCFIGEDEFQNVVMFDLTGKIFAEYNASSFHEIDDGFMVKTPNGSFMYDKKFNLILGDIQKSYYINYTYWGRDKSYNFNIKHESLIQVAHTKDGIVLFDRLKPIVEGVDELKEFQYVDDYSHRRSVYAVRKGNGWDILGPGYFLIDNGSFSFDSVEKFSNSDKCRILKIKKQRKENIVNMETLWFVSKKWYDEIAQIPPGLLFGTYLPVAVRNGNRCNIINADIRDKELYGKLMLKRSVRDFMVSGKFLVAESGGKDFVVWKDGYLIRCDYCPLSVGPLVFVLWTEDRTCDLADKTKDWSFCEKYNNGERLDLVEITEDDVLGLIGEKGKLSYVHIGTLEPAFLNSDGSIRWFDQAEPAVPDNSGNNAICDVVENGKHLTLTVPC